MGEEDTGNITRNTMIRYQLEDLRKMGEIPEIDLSHDTSGNPVYRDTRSGRTVSESEAFNTLYDSKRS